MAKALKIAGIIIVIATAIACIVFYLQKNEPQVLSDSSDIYEEKLYWENVVSESPTYRDGWIRLSRIYYTLGEKDLSSGAWETAKAIDPNMEISE